MGAFLWPTLLILAGLVLMIAGGEALVRGASALAAAMRISPLVIGLTVVAFGTSSPELAVSIQAGLTGKPDLAIGNVVGSNITNVLLILGVSALISPLVVASQLIRWDVPLMIVTGLLMLAMALDGTIGRLDGCILFATLLGYTTWLIFQSRRETAEVKTEFESQAVVARDGLRTPLQVGLIVLGLVLLGFGSHWLVNGAVQIARMLGVTELIIGLTIVAVGTSLPEIVTSITASIRGQRDIAVGNVVGSNVFNILGVLGLSSIVAPDGISVSESALRFDIPIMIAVSIACFPILFTGNLVARWEGGLFFGYYIAYTTYLVLAALQSNLTRSFGVIMVAFVIPLTSVTLLVCLLRVMRGAPRHRSE